MKVTLSVQGTLLKVKTTSEQPPPDKTARRGAVCGFSKKSRKRLLELCARLMPVKKTVFITLTYPQEFPDAKTAKKHLRAFMERIRRRCETASGVWRLEFQKRGAPHFHILLWNCSFIPKEEIQQMWADIIDYATPFTRIELIRSNRKVMSYVAKYVAKPTSDSEGESERGFNITPYLHAGRVWGIFNGDYLPYDVESTATQEMEPEAFLALREIAKGIYPNLYDEYPMSGFTLFMDDPMDFVRQAFAFADAYG